MSEFTEETQRACMEVITYAGNARSLYIKAVHAARHDEKDQAAQLVEEARASYNRAHDAHLKLFGAESDGSLEIGLLLVHAEDQLMSAETFGILADEMLQP